MHYGTGLNLSWLIKTLLDNLVVESQKLAIWSKARLSSSVDLKVMLVFDYLTLRVIRDFWHELFHFFLDFSSIVLEFRLLKLLFEFLHPLLLSCDLCEYFFVARVHGWHDLFFDRIWKRFAFFELLRLSHHILPLDKLVIVGL